MVLSGPGGERRATSVRRLAWLGALVVDVRTNSWAATGSLCSWPRRRCLHMSTSWPSRVKAEAALGPVENGESPIVDCQVRADLACPDGCIRETIGESSRSGCYPCR